MSSATFKEVMAALRTAGTTATAERYASEGVAGPCFGVELDDLRRMAEPLQREQAMALQLFETGVFDARLLATLIADPARLTAANCDRWVKAVDHALLCRALAELIGQTKHAEKKSDVWRGSKGEWKRVAGWTLVELLAEPDVALHLWLKGRVGEIHRGLKKAPPGVQGAMRATLIAIGGHRPEMRERVLGLAKKFKLKDVRVGVEALQAQWEAQA